MIQADLADAISVQTQQIQRCESSNYMGDSLTRLLKISKVLNVHTPGLRKPLSQVDCCYIRLLSLIPEFLSVMIPLTNLAFPDNRVANPNQVSGGRLFSNIMAVSRI